MNNYLVWKLIVFFYYFGNKHERRSKKSHGIKNCARKINILVEDDNFFKLTVYFSFELIDENELNEKLDE